MFTFYPNRHDSIGSPNVQSLLSVISKRGQGTKERKLTECHRNCILDREKLSALQLRHEKVEEILDLNFNESQEFHTKILTHIGIRESERTNVEIS